MVDTASRGYDEHVTAFLPVTRLPFAAYVSRMLLAVVRSRTVAIGSKRGLVCAYNFR